MKKHMHNFTEKAALFSFFFRMAIRSFTQTEKAAQVFADHFKSEFLRSITKASSNMETDLIFSKQKYSDVERDVKIPIKEI